MNKHLSKFFGILCLLLELIIVPEAVELMLSQNLSELPSIRIVALAMTFGSIALCILMSYSAISEQDDYPLQTFLFELMVFLCCIAPMTELITEALDTAGRPALNMLVNTIYYLIGINIAYVIMLYEFRIIGAKRNPALPKVRRAASFLMLLDNIATLLNIRFGYFFTISETGMYESAPTFWLAFIVPMLIIALTVLTAYREMKPGRQQRTFLCYWIFAILASFLQIRNDALSVQYTGYTLSIIVIYINVQSELDTSCMNLTEREV